MPELVEQMYCSQQIVIPPKLPYILKRYCKAAIKTQPYDLLRWSYEYFKALAQKRPPPVKLRLEYPVFSTEGGLTKGCLKVLAKQMASMSLIPLPVLKSAWGSFCLDPEELRRVLCLCGVYMRQETVPYLHLVAVAGGLLTKSLTHTMILVCETLTKEPDGGSAAISVVDFLVMYKFLARMDASKDVKYLDGYREDENPQVEEEEPEEMAEEETDSDHTESLDSFWMGASDLQTINVIKDRIPRSARLSVRIRRPAVDSIERSPSMERACQIERENYMRERKGRAVQNEEVNKMLRELSALGQSFQSVTNVEAKVKVKEEKGDEVKKSENVEIVVHDEDGNVIPYKIYGEPPEIAIDEEYGEEIEVLEEQKEEEAVDSSYHINLYLAECYAAQASRQDDLETTFDEIRAIVDRFTSANYDLANVAGRQMSTTSGEFIAHAIEKEILAYIDEQIAILPDPDLKKKKAKPEEVAMVKHLLETFIEENMHIIVPELEDVEEEEHPIPEITLVHAVPGIGPPVDPDIIALFKDYALDVSRVQGELFMPRNIRHFLCPPLERYGDHKFDEDDSLQSTKNVPSKSEVASSIKAPSRVSTGSVFISDKPRESRVYVKSTVDIFEDE